VPYAKGKGHSMMVADFVSADYGWLQSPDGKETAHVIFKAGKNRDGYFTNDDVLKQTDTAMDIVKKHYGDEEHKFVFDNAPTHLKHLNATLSAQKMTKGPSTTFGIEVTVVVDGKVQYLPNGKPQKCVVPMGPRKFADGSPQNFYNTAGILKGMTVILEECRLAEEAKLWAECKKFQCTPGATRCCQC
jgi:hypothetical protein